MQWTTDGNGDPVPSVEGNAVEQETWYDPCEGTENDPQTASHGYSLVSDEVVYNPDDGQFNREVTYSASSSFGGPDNVITGTHALVRHWSPTPSNINGGEKEIPQSGTLTVLPGEIVTLSVTPATDEDTWTMAGVGSGTDPDTVSYAWSSSDGTFQGDIINRTVQWQAPQDVGTYTVTVTIDDAPALVTAPDTGSRDDSSLSQSFTIKVAPKVWDTDLAIGNARQEDGTSIENGRMVLPQDQSGEDPVPEHVKVFAGKTIDLSVEAATDVDHWKVEDTDLEGYDNDTVTYSWSASSGEIVGDANQRNAKWQAPTDAGTYTLTCTIDDTPKAIGAQEQGSRDDSAITRTVDVEVINGESSATLKLYQDEALTNEVDGDTVGGTAYIVLEVKLGAGQHLVSNSATLRVEENYPQHSEAERRWDSSISFGSGWQKKDANGDWQPSGSPQSTNSTEDDEYFRLAWLWQTTTTPLGHNETHTIKLVNVDGGDDTELTFAPETGDGETKGPSGISADVKNLVITEVKAGDDSEDYLIYDPESQNSQYANPSVEFKFEDDGGYRDGDEYRWTVFLLETSGANVTIQTGVATEPGSVTTNINPDYPGIFGFDVWVKHYRNGTFLDEQGYRSKVVEFTDDNLAFNENDQLEFQYHITPNDDDVQDLSEVDITMLNGDWTKGAQVSGSKTLNPLPDPAHKVTLPDPTSQEPGEGRVIITGVDNEALRYRDHENRRLGPYNKVLRKYFMFLGAGPQLPTVDSGSLSPLKTQPINLSGEIAAYLFTRPLHTLQTPEEIWKELANVKKSVGLSGSTWRHALATTTGHGNVGIHMVSSLPGGFNAEMNNNSLPRYAAWTTSHGVGAGVAYPFDGAPNYVTTVADYNITDITVPHLFGISFYNMMACYVSKGSAPNDHVATDGSPIAQVISHQKSAGNSMGYETETYYGSPHGSPGQLWFEDLFSPPSLSKASAHDSGYYAQGKYLYDLVIQGFDHCSNPLSTPSWGFDSWVITNTAPILDR